VDKSLFSEEFLKKLDKLVFISKNIPSGSDSGVQKTYKKGSSLEFNDYRTYSPGDDIRSIDWNVWERLGQLFLKLYSADVDRTVSILIDTSSSMGTDKLTFSLQTAAALGYIGIKNQDRVSISSITDTIVDYMKPTKGKGDIISLFNFLSSLKSGGKTDLSRALKEVSLKNPKNSIIILLSDLLDFEGFKDGIYHLLYKKFDIVVLHTLSANDLAPNFSGPVRLKDSETGAVLDLTVNRETLTAYKNTMSAYFKKIENICLEKRIEYIRVSSSTPFEDLILKYMRQKPGLLVGGLQ
jgi:uncharacterized protein (DUF58 family)